LRYRSAQHAQRSDLIGECKGDLAALHYFPAVGHPGFRSVGDLAGLEGGETTTFCMDDIHEELEIINDAIVPFASAAVAAKEFFMSEEMPSSMEWFEL